jgi:hypothetical protein
LRVALCITGHFRAFDAAWPWLKRNVIDQHNPDIFAHAWTESFGIHQHIFDKNHPSFRLGYDPSSSPLPKFYVDNVAKRLNPKVFMTENQNDINPMIDGLIQKYAAYNHPWEWYRPKLPFCQAYSRGKVMAQKSDYEQKNRFIYDKVIFTRWDIVHERYIPDTAFNSENLILPNRYAYNGLCDMWAIGSSHQLDTYAAMLDDIEQVKDSPDFNTGIHIWVKCHLDYHKVPYQQVDIPIALCNRFQ